MKTEKMKFKWNPFTIFGESPSGLRFKTEFDNLEFASKEDLEAIKADPRLSKYYNAVQAGVTKYFQASSEKEKRFLQTIENLQSQMAELDGGLQEWENWFVTNREALANLGRPSDEGDLSKGKRVRAREGDEGMFEQKFNQLVTAINQTGAKFERELKQTKKELALSMQLNELYRKHPEMDGEKLLDAALKVGELDLNRVYDDVYHEDILNREIEMKMQPKVEEEVQRRMTKVETGSGATPIKFELPKDASKSWTDLGQDFLKERAAEAAKGNP